VPPDEASYHSKEVPEPIADIVAELPQAIVGDAGELVFIGAANVFTIIVTAVLGDEHDPSVVST
jgi:hypothetical protein